MMQYHSNEWEPIEHIKLMEKNEVNKQTEDGIQ